MSQAFEINPDSDQGADGKASKTLPWCCVGTAVVGIVLAILGSILPPSIFEGRLMEASVVCDDQDADYEAWESNLLTDDHYLDSYTDFYVYDVSNPKEFLTGEKKAKVVENGPWAFLCQSKKVAIKFQDSSVEYDTYTSCESSDSKLDTKITHFNAAYSQILASAQSEGLLLLALSKCTPAQIQNIGFLDLRPVGTQPCSWNEDDGPGSDSKCACCIPNLLSKATGFVPADTVRELYYDDNSSYALCPEIASTTSDAGKALSGMARLDGGVEVEEGKVWSPLMVTKTVREMALGYPSSLAGLLSVGSLLTNENIGAAVKAICDSVGDPAKCYADPPMVKALAILLHETDIGGLTLGKFSKDVSAVCASKCKKNTGCTGYSDNTTEDIDLKYLSGIDCAPLTPAFMASVSCQDGASKGTCTCSDGEAVEGTKVCGCFAGGLGIRPGTGCMARVPGFLNARNIYNDMQASVYRPPAKNNRTYKENTGCKDADNIGDNVQEILEYDGATELPVWMRLTDHYLPTPGDITTFKSWVENPKLDVENKIKFVKVSGKTGFQVRADGLSGRSWASSDLSDGSASVEEISIFVSQLSTAVALKAHGEVQLMGINLHRFQPEDDFMSSSKEGNKELGFIKDGINVAAFRNGFALVVSQPRFLFGDDKLLTEIELIDQDAKAITKESVSTNQAQYQVTLDMESSTGKAFSGHSRLMASIYNYRCNPEVDPSCGLFPYPEKTCDGAKAVGYACSVANVFTPMAPAEILIPTFWSDQRSELPSDSADTFKGLGSTLQLLQIISVLLLCISIAMMVYGLYVMFSSK